VRRQLPRRLSVLTEDGCDHDYKSADLVYVVNHVIPKGGVLNQIAATASQSVRLLVRDPVGPGRLLADCIDTCLPSPWELVETGKPDPHFFSRHLVLRRTLSK
jgi:hypothetical protein